MNKLLPAYLSPLDSLDSETHITPCPNTILPKSILPSLPPKKKKSPSFHQQVLPLRHWKASNSILCINVSCHSPVK